MAPSAHVQSYPLWAATRFSSPASRPSNASLASGGSDRVSAPPATRAGLSSTSTGTPASVAMRSVTALKESGASSSTAISLAASEGGSGTRTGASSVAASAAVPIAVSVGAGRSGGSASATPYQGVPLDQGVPLSAASEPPALTNRNTIMAPATMPGPSGQ